MTRSVRRLPPYRQSLAGALLTAREAVMAPIRPILRVAGVTEQQWRTLRVLVDEGPTDTSKLARSALLHAPSLTRILKELADRGLVVRQADPTDGRRSIIAVSPAGRTLVERTALRTLAVLDEYARRFGVDRLSTLQNDLFDLASEIADLAETRDGATAPAPPQA